MNVPNFWFLPRVPWARNVRWRVLQLALLTSILLCVFAVLVILDRSQLLLVPLPPLSHVAPSIMGVCLVIGGSAVALILQGAIARSRGVDIWLLFIVVPGMIAIVSGALMGLYSLLAYRHEPASVMLDKLPSGVLLTMVFYIANCVWLVPLGALSILVYRAFLVRMGSGLDTR